jgi:hypothetical protein
MFSIINIIGNLLTRQNTELGISEHSSILRGQLENKQVTNLEAQQLGFKYCGNVVNLRNGQDSVSASSSRTSTGSWCFTEAYSLLFCFPTSYW